MRHAILVAALASGTLYAQPAPPPPAPAQPAAGTVQEQFDAATTMLREEKWPDALATLNALEARLANAGNRRSLAIVRLRRAEALARFHRFNEAEAAIRDNLPILSDDDATLAEDRLRAMLTFGLIAELRLDYAEAARRYTAALTAPGPDILRLMILRGLVQTQMFETPHAALAHADQAAALATTIPNNRRILGQISSWRGRVLLNQRRLPEAREALTTAIDQLGGLSNAADASDVIARSDMAIVALLRGDEAQARRYLAYTGAGRYRRGYVSPLDARPTPCGGSVGRDDVAVIEFAVGEEGEVRSAAPVYATRWEAGRAFAETVSGWRFDPTALGAISRLFLNLNRVEMRCTEAESSGDGSRVTRALGWAGIAPDDASGVEPSVAELREQLARARGASPPAPLALFEALTRLAQRPADDGEETRALLLQAIVIARRSDVAPRIDPLRIASILYARANPSQGEQAEADEQRLLDHPVTQGDRRVALALRIMLASVHYHARRDEQAAALLDQALGEPAMLAPDLRGEALALQVAVRAAQGDWNGARAARAALGAGAPRCGAVPRAEPVDTSRGDFPREAQRWGFEGWAAVEGAVAQDGRVSSARTVIAYPAFVFSAGAERLRLRAVSAPTLTGDGQPCFYGQRQIRFLLQY